MTRPNDNWAEWFEAAWAHRENVVYRELFGDISTGIFVLEPSVFLKTFRQDTFDPRWLHSGVFESGPNDKHESWLYVSSGLSNPWEDEAPDPTGYSGLGCEFIFETTAQGMWAIERVQHLVAFQTLLSCGRYPGRDLLGAYDRIPLRCPITPEPSVLHWLMIAPPEGYPSTVQLQSGELDLLRVVGISEAEAQFAREHTGEDLLEILRGEKAFPVTNPRRPCTITRAGAV